MRTFTHSYWTDRHELSTFELFLYGWMCCGLTGGVHWLLS